MSEPDFIPTGWGGMEAEPDWEDEGSVEDEAEALPLYLTGIDSDEKAEWFLKQLFLYDSRSATVEGRFGFEIGRLEQQRDAQLAEIRSLKANILRLYASSFEAFCKQKIAEKKKGRTLHYFHGSVKLRTVPQSLKVEDESAAVKWADENGPLSFLEVTKRLKRKEYLAYVKESGELLPGVVTTPSYEKFDYSGREDIEETHDEDN